MHFAACHAFHCLVSVHGSLLCPSKSLIHSACITFQGFAVLNYLSLHSVSIHFSLFQSTGCLVRLACGSLRAAANFIICLHFVLAIKAVALCSTLHAVMVFVQRHSQPELQKPCQPSASTCAVHRPHTSGFLSTTLAQLAVASRVQAVGRKKIAPYGLPF